MLEQFAQIERRTRGAVVHERRDDKVRMIDLPGLDGRRIAAMPTRLAGRSRRTFFALRRDKLPIITRTLLGVVDPRSKTCAVQSNDIKSAIANGRIVSAGHGQAALRPQAGERLGQFVPGVTG